MEIILRREVVKTEDVDFKEMFIKLLHDKMFCANVNKHKQPILQDYFSGQYNAYQDILFYIRDELK